MAEIVTTAELTRRGFLSFATLAGIGAFFRAPEIVAEAVNVQAITPSASMDSLSQVQAELVINGHLVAARAWGFEICGSMRSRTVRFYVELPWEEAEKVNWNFAGDNLLSLGLTYPSGVRIELTTKEPMQMLYETDNLVVVKIEQTTPNLLAKYIE